METKMFSDDLRTQLRAYFNCTRVLNKTEMFKRILEEIDPI